MGATRDDEHHCCRYRPHAVPLATGRTAAVLDRDSGALAQEDATGTGVVG